MGTIKDRNSMDLTEAEDIKKRWQEFTEKLYKKDLNDPDNHDGVITHLSSVQFSCSVVSDSATPSIAAHEASLSVTNSQSSLRLTSIELVMSSSHLILCRPLFSCPQSLPASESFPMSQLFA